MAHAKINPETREVTLTIDRPVPPRDMRAHLHRLLDEAIDSIAATDPIGAPPSGAIVIDDTNVQFTVMEPRNG